MQETARAKPPVAAREEAKQIARTVDDWTAYNGTVTVGNTTSYQPTIVSNDLRTMNYNAASLTSAGR